MKVLSPLSILALAATVFLSVASLQPAQAQLTPQVWSEGYCVINGIATIQGLQCLFVNLFAVIIPMIGFMTFVMLVWGAVRYMLSGGNPKNVESARNTIKFALIGIVVALSAYFVLQILANITGIKRLEKFQVPGSNFTDEF